MVWTRVLFLFYFVLILLCVCVGVCLYVYVCLHMFFVPMVCVHVLRTVVHMSVSVCVYVSQCFVFLPKRLHA